MTPNFSDSELSCKCGCGMLPQLSFMEKVERLRNIVGFALPVASAARCPDYNEKVSRTGRDGPHTTGRAIDLAVTHWKALRVIEVAIALGFSGIGVNQKGQGRFIHLDDLTDQPGRPRPTIWSY